MQKRSPDTTAGLLRWLMAAQTGLLPTQPITAQINLGLSLWLDEKRGSRHQHSRAYEVDKKDRAGSWPPPTINAPSSPYASDSADAPVADGGSAPKCGPTQMPQTLSHLEDDSAVFLSMAKQG